MVKQDGDPEVFSSMRVGLEKMPAYRETRPKKKKRGKTQGTKWMPVVWTALVVVAFLIGLVTGLML